jgi:hypothetical protein
MKRACPRPYRDPKAPLGIRVFFNLESGEKLLQGWSKWQAHDPMELVDKYRTHLRSLRGISIDYGWND